MGEPFKALGIAEIQGLNKTVIDKFGGMYVEGDGNFHNRGSLEHILEATLFPSFGEELYPTIYGKIAAISQVIITRHVFHDGNKRTALALIEALGRLNKFNFKPTKKDEDFLVLIAERNLEISQVEAWLKRRLKLCPAL